MPDQPLNQFSSTEEASNMLQQGMVDIYFIKVTNGLSRHLRCTLNEHLIPEGQSDTLLQILGNIQTINPDGSLPIPVWDLEKRGWRSFYIDSTFEIVPSQIDFKEVKEEAQEAEEQEEEESVLEEAEELLEEKVQEEGMGFILMGIIKKRLKTKIENLPKTAIDVLAKGGSSMMKQFISQVLPKKKM